MSTGEGPNHARAAALLALGAAVVLAALLTVGHVGEAGRAQGPPLRDHRSSHGLSSLPVGTWTAISRGLGADQRAFWAHRVARGQLVARNRVQRLSAHFSRSGVAVSTSAGDVGLSLRGLGYAGRLTRVEASIPQSSRNRVSYGYRGLSEWYVNGPSGVEQGFRLSAAPRRRAAGPLTLALALRGSLRPSLSRDAQTITLAPARGAAALRYGTLRVTDASGRALRSWLSLDGGVLSIRVDDVGARYPLTVDPFVQSAKLTASDGAAGNVLGDSVAVSGTTVVVGAPQSNSNQGAAYVFTEPAGGWADATETAKLTASDGVAGDLLGSSVAVSGSTVVLGASQAKVGSNSFQGAAYVFTEPGGGWAGNLNETAKLTASDGAAGDRLGTSVTVSGSTVVAGAPQAKVGSNSFQGAAYVFTEPGGGWASATESAKLTASDGAGGDRLGSSVAVSGPTVVAGASQAKVGPNSAQGAAYVFSEPGGGWGTAIETAKLTASDGAAGNQLGFSVAVDGSTVVAGNNNASNSAAYVYTEPGGGWASATETAELTDSNGDSNDQFGYSVAVSGSTVAVGAREATVGDNVNQGAAYVFAEPAGGWADATETAELTASDGAAGASLGYSVAVAGSTVVAGAPDATVAGNGDQGAAYVFASPSTSVCGAHGVFSLSGSTASCSYTNAAEDTFTAPDGVSTVHVVAIGGHGGSGAGDASGTGVGGLGGLVTGDLPVTAGQPLYVEVGGNGADGTTSSFGGTGGFNGGATGGNFAPSPGAGGGGGASDVRSSARSDTGSLSSRLLVAAGGGGGGSGATLPGTSGNGGAAGAAGGAGSDSSGGGAGTQSAGGGGGAPGGSDGTAGAGGAGGGGNACNGGGGGGGDFGGGGGSTGPTSAPQCPTFPVGPGGGGGGGSNLLPAGGTAAADTSGTPQITISYTVPSSNGSPSGSSTPVNSTTTAAASSTSGNSNGRRLPNNHFRVTHVRIRRNGTVSFRLRAPGPGRVDVLETAWLSAFARPAYALRPAAGRFVFARKHLNVHARRTVRVTVTPNRRGKLLVKHHRKPVVIRLWVRYTPAGGKPRDVRLHDLRIPR